MINNPEGLTALDLEIEVLRMEAEYGLSEETQDDSNILSQSFASEDHALDQGNDEEKQ